MTVPMQRGGNQDDPTVTNLILGAIDDLKSHVVRLEGHLTTRMEGLTREFLPRGEYEARHSDVRNQITKLDARVDAEVARLEAAQRSQDERITSQRRFAIATSLTAVTVIIGLLSLILANLP